MNFTCPHCQILLSDEGMYDGQLAFCPRCRGQFYVPSQLPAVIEPEIVDEGAVDSTEPLFTYVTISDDGHISARYCNVGEARLALKELRLLKKQLALAKRQVKQQQKATRAEHTDYVRRRGSKFIGGGGIGRFIRTVQTISRDHTRYQLANSLAPLEQ